METTLAIVKPDAVAAGHLGGILDRILKEGFRIAGLKMLRLSQDQAEGFYAVHRERPFFADLTRFMTSGPVVMMVLERPDAIATWRRLMGATDPAKAEDGTLRKEFGTNVERNATHGSDAPETSATEIAYFFNMLEICSTD
ncbi:MAG: nucleoside-diphosphate kinase [Acidobacteria bacterium]|nr:nucleoside-diphosphate kinase [Acidobacteriota bacterium]MCZ6745662.1 nucleoside-diphosphate kinase [Acidobacteriota bacterium]